MTEYYTNIDT